MISGTLVVELGLLLLAALIAGLVIRRLSTAAEDLRDVRAAQALVSNVHDRVVAAVDPLVLHLDEVRHGLHEPTEAREEVAEVRHTMLAAIEEVGTVRGAGGVDGAAAALLAGLERTERALDLVDHGLAGLVGQHHNMFGEGQTQLKRGLLGIRHGRDEVQAATRAALAVRSRPSARSRRGLGSDRPPGG
jgi:hypothetical protein